MRTMSYKKYQPYPLVSLPERTWPSRQIIRAPQWCSVDLRDGNQALPAPMRVEEKLEYFRLLLQIGFKQIEVGFPSASQTEFDFLRRLADEQLIPEDVTIQVLTQAREHLIRRTFEALAGIPRAIVHFYNSTSELQRRVVFRKTRGQTLQLAKDGMACVKACAQALPQSKIQFEYSPESYTGTEPDFALEVCEAVMDVAMPTLANPIILNLPATVEMASPNIFADSIELFLRRISRRDSLVLSVHTHNDRGTAVAAAELALLAGAQRVEGTLFGNGERTGNLDIVTLALNLFSQGIDPQLDFTDLPRIASIYERVTRLSLPARQPYAGDLVFTAFSGSHQDAIAKGFHAQRPDDNALWEVPYLPIDPADIGRDYKAIIRINSQSGKGGVAYILETTYGYNLPKNLHPEIGAIIQRQTDDLGRELSVGEILRAFQEEYLHPQARLNLISWDLHTPGIAGASDSPTRISVKLSMDGREQEAVGSGNGPLDAFAQALKTFNLPEFTIAEYSEHALSEGSNARAVCYVRITVGSRDWFGVGEDSNLALASLRALLCALNRSLRK